MKRIVEIENESGLESLLGQEVTLWCECYIYAGKLKAVSETDVLLTNAKIVYETGELNKPGFKDAQDLPSDWWVRVSKIESYGVMK